MSAALEETRLPEPALAAYWRQSLGDAIGAALAAAADVYRHNDLSAWRSMESAAERLREVALMGREGLEAREEVPVGIFGKAARP